MLEIVFGQRKGTTVRVNVSVKTVRDVRSRLLATTTRKQR